LLDGPGPRIEVFRAEAGGAPLAAERDDIDLLVTDDEVDVRAPVVARSDLRTVATRVLSLAGLR
ncbi:MAG: molybdopterin-guanine dinucleotide biosynthesis protein B, partial [Acidobacteria bacterium]